MSRYVYGHELFEAAKEKLATAAFSDALKLMKLAARRRHLPAMVAYASLVEMGVGGRPSAAKAMPWYELAAWRGDEASCLRLGQWHASQGRTAQAKFWLSGMRRNPHAMLLLAGLYAQSRSDRATTRMRLALSGAGPADEIFSEEERQEHARLTADLATRVPWNPLKR